MKPVDAVLAVTYRCNARCAMCGIWKSQPGPDLPPEVYRKLPSSLRDVNLTGGEPFLRDDLAAVHEAATAACPRAQTVISTNGLRTDRIVSATREIAKREPNVGIAVSIDGPPRMHDRLRGVPGAFNRAIATVEALQEAGFRNLRLAFTATRTNLQCFGEVYDLARRLGTQFTCAIEHGSSHYFHTDRPNEPLPEEELRLQLEPIIENELWSLSPKRWGRAYFMKGLYDFATGRERPLPCRAGRDFFFMDPQGDIYTCNAMPFRMGNLATQSLDEIFRSPEGQEALEKAARCQAGCWMICTARTAIKRKWLRVLIWALTSRFRRVLLPGRRA